MAEKHEIVCVYTKEPKEAGRGKDIQKTPIHLWAEEKGIEVRTPKSLKSEEEQEKFAKLDADISGTQWIRRGFAAILMILAIALYSWAASR